MAQHYSDERRASHPYTLPDLETFEITATGTPWEDSDGERLEPGWYWWTCLPGCMPDSDPQGPYDSEEDALIAAREGDDGYPPDDCHDFDDIDD